MKNKFSWEKIEKPVMVLAPMAGVADSPFRQICKSLGADVVCSEMISSEGLVRRDKKTFEMAQFKKSERPIIIQIFGKDPKVMAEAGKIVQNEIGADGVDINMGCPARKVISSFHGVALMRDILLAEKIVGAVRKAIKIPLSVKTRLGWKNKSEILTFARMSERCDVDLVSIHARTKKQGFSGEPDWKIVAKVKEKAKIPILVSGGIMDLESSARALLESRADGLMIARGALGNPWIFENLNMIKKNPKLYLSKKVFGFDKSVSSKERFEVTIRHAELAEKEKGKRGIREMRKHLGWYVKGLPGAKRLRERLVRVKTIEEIKEILKS